MFCIKQLHSLFRLQRYNFSPNYASIFSFVNFRSSIKPLWKYSASHWKTAISTSAERNILQITHVHSCLWQV
nr:MAG TPA: hypothetical protein [Caudoviricetes sp.]